MDTLKDMNADKGVRMVIIQCHIANFVASEASQESFLKPRNS